MYEPLVVTAWLAAPVIFDGRNLYDPAVISRAGFTYASIGRATVAPAKP